jgi:hypothetical protein
MRDKGSLFNNKDKKKPSQHDMQGECTLGGAPFEMRAWLREEQLTLSLALPRGDQNTYPPDTFKGALDLAPKPTRAAKAKDEVPPTWAGEILSDEARYAVRAFEKQGKAGSYLTLAFERLEMEVAPANVDDFDVSE